VIAPTYDHAKSDDAPADDGPTNDAGHPIGCDCPECLPPEYAPEDPAQARANIAASTALLTGARLTGILHRARIAAEFEAWWRWATDQPLPNNKL
jgi:hypothetical protein